MDTDIFIVSTKTEDAETRFDTSNYELARLLPKRKNKQVIGFMLAPASFSFSLEL